MCQNGIKNRIKEKFMEDWMINLIIGIFSAILGFVGGFFTKTYQIKVKQKIKGNNNTQTIGNINNGK